LLRDGLELVGGLFIDTMPIALVHEVGTCFMSHHTLQPTR
jgi:hypothetical protein